MHGPGPTHFTFGREAAAQIAKQVRYIERLPRNRQPHRRRSVSPGAGNGAAIGVLTTTLYYGATAGAQCQLYGPPPGDEQPVGSPVTVYGWMLDPGDSIGATTMVALCKVNGVWYVFNASCGPYYYQAPAAPCDGCGFVTSGLTISGATGSYSSLNGSYSLSGSGCTYTASGASICGAAVTVTLTADSVDGNATLVISNANGSISYAAGSGSICSGSVVWDASSGTNSGGGLCGDGSKPSGSITWF